MYDTRNEMVIGNVWGRGCICLRIHDVKIIGVFAMQSTLVRWRLRSERGLCVIIETKKNPAEYTAAINSTFTALLEPLYSALKCGLLDRENIEEM